MSVGIIEHGEQGIFSGVAQITYSPLAQFALDLGHVHEFVSFLQDLEATRQGDPQKGVGVVRDHCWYLLEYIGVLLDIEDI